MRTKKIISKIILKIAILVRPFNQRTYDTINTRRLKWLGVKISDVKGDYSFISPSAFIDGSDYSLIKIGKRTVISNDVILLTHDASIKQGLRSINIDIPLGKKITFLKPITIGDNCFLGIRSTVLPGAIIGNNTIVAAGAVVVGKEYPEGVILGGVPAKIIGNTRDWTFAHINDDYAGKEEVSNAK